MMGQLTMIASARSEKKMQGEHERADRPTWWQATWQRLQKRVWPARQPVALRKSPAATTTTSADSLLAGSQQQGEHQATLRYGVRTSTLALVVTTTGRLCYPPLQVAGLPLLVYMGIPAAQQAYDELAEEGRPGWAVAETVMLAVCLAGGYYWVGAFGFWLYYGGRTLLAEKRPEAEAQAQQPEWSASTTTHLWKDGVACVVPIATLQPGDQVLLHSGEMVPVDGLITEGVAWLRPQALSSAACGLRKSVGDRVAAMDLVMVGRICVGILPEA
jgi:Cu2+-exporting ATPase